MYKSLNISLHRAAKRNHKAVGVERFRWFLNHSNTLISHQRETHNCFIESSVIAAYVWNAIPIDGTDIVGSISAIGRPLRFPMYIAIDALAIPITDVVHVTVRYLQDISNDSKFARDLVMWLTEDRHERHRERINTAQKTIQYNA